MTLALSRIDVVVAVNLALMANLATFDPQSRGREARVRALLDDLVHAHIEGRPMTKLALAVWYQKSHGSEDQYLLELIIVDAFPFKGFHKDRLSLLWKSGSEGQPYANVEVTSADYFVELLAAHPAEATQYHEGDFEVLYFNKDLLSIDASYSQIIEFFRIVTEPRGLMKGWFVTQEEYDQSSTAQSILSRRRSSKPELGIVKVMESPDLANSRGILHVEIEGKWLPLSPEAIRSYTYYADAQSGRRAYFIFEGGALYEILRFEVKAGPEYAGRLLGKTPDDRYPEVYLRAVHPPTQPAA